MAALNKPAAAGAPQRAIYQLAIVLSYQRSTHLGSNQHQNFDSDFCSVTTSILDVLVNSLQAKDDVL